MKSPLKKRKKQEMRPGLRARTVWERMRKSLKNEDIQAPKKMSKIPMGNIWVNDWEVCYKFYDWKDIFLHTRIWLGNIPILFTVHVYLEDLGRTWVMFHNIVSLHWRVNCHLADRVNRFDDERGRPQASAVPFPNAPHLQHQSGKRKSQTVFSFPNPTHE